MLTVSLVLVLLALGLTVASWMGKAPLAAAVLVLVLIHLIAILPQ